MCGRLAKTTFYRLQKPGQKSDANPVEHNFNFPFPASRIRKGIAKSGR